MTPVRPEFYPLLFLLLQGLWVAEVPVTAKPPNMTSAQWFTIQHVQPSPQPCNLAMAHINNYTKHCKPLNTFLHEPSSSVVNTCQTTSIACKNGKNNCHTSQQPVSLTMCNLTSGTYPGCKYKENQTNKFYTVACEPPKPQDVPYPLVPVHLDKVF